MMKEQKKKIDLEFKGGLSDFVRYLDKQNNPLHNKIIVLVSEREGITVD